MAAWMIRAGHKGVYAADWFEKGCVGVGWGDFGTDDISTMSYEQIFDAYAAANPSFSKNKIANGASQVFHFGHDVVEGSTVVMYDAAERIYHVGTVAGPCKPVADTDGLTYSRKVKWRGIACRDNLSLASRNSLGSTLTVFTVNDTVMAELEAALGKKKPQVAGIVSTVAEDDEPIKYTSPDDGIEAIKDRVTHLSWEDMEFLTAGLLRAMGYHASVTGPGPDGGRDVEATLDALGLEHPRVVAEVKHRKGAMGAPAIRSFMAGLHGDERGLYVSTGGFSKDAKIEAMHAPRPIRLVDIDDFVRLYVENYNNADEETRNILPLGCIWYPA